MAKQLLVVEDSKHVAQVIEHIGKSLGYEVTLACSFAEVRKLLSKPHDFFLATIDFRLPDAPEGEVIPFVLQHKIPGVVMTGRMDDRTRTRILNHPVVDYITKENAQAFHYLLRILKYQMTNHTIGVLVVDDSLTARNQVIQLLQRRNFKTYGVPDGTKALAALEQYRDIKMVITDQEMPGMDGIELVQRIRKDHAKDQLIIIALSGAEKGSQSARFIKNGADDFLRKPFCPEEFYCRITQNIEKLQHLEEIRKVANTDYLTELSNRRYFFEQAAVKLRKSKTSKQKYLLLMLDLDHFKAVNDTHGHDIGDLVLVEFSKLLRHHFTEDLVARLGGEEFAVLLQTDDLELTTSQIDVFREAVSAMQIKTQSVTFHVTCSMGGALVDPEKDIKNQLGVADLALYQAKENGRNRYVLSE